MRHCPECGRQNEDHWKFCMGCGVELPAEPASSPAVVRPDGIAAPPVMRPPEPSAAAPGRYEVEIPRYQGGQAAAGKPGAKPALLIAVMAAVALAGAVAFLLMRSTDAGESGASGRAEPVRVQPAVVVPQPSPAAPAEPVGTVDRALLEAELLARQAADDVKRELRQEWEAANTEPDPAAGRPATPDRALLRDRFAALQETIYACAAGRAVTVTTRVTFEGPTGRVLAAVVDGELPAEAKECIVEVLRGMSVAPFAEDSLTVSFPYQLGAP